MNKNRLYVCLSLLVLCFACSNCFSDNPPNATVTFNLELVTVGKGSNWTSEKAGYPDTSSTPFRLTATISPLSVASSVSFDSDDTSSVTVSEVSRSDGEDSQTVILQVTGVAASTSASGNAKIQAKKDGSVVKKVPVVVIIPKTQTHAVSAGAMMNSYSYNNGFYIFRTEAGSLVTITIKDQFGNKLSRVYDGANVVQEKFASRVISSTDMNTVNGLLANGAWPLSYQYISSPNNILLDGEIGDAVTRSTVFPVGGVSFNAQQLADWIAMTGPILGSNNAFEYNSLVESWVADQYIKVDVTELTTDFERTMSVDGGESQPVTVTDVIN